MPFKLILFIIILLVIGAFIGFNSGITSEIKIWPSEKGTFTEVPILLSFFVMYVIGVLSVIPFFVGYRNRKEEKKKTDSEAKKSKNEESKEKTRVLGTKSSHAEPGNEQDSDTK